MQAGADLLARLRRAALWRRGPMWPAGALPWLLLAFFAPWPLALGGLLLWCACSVWDYLRLRTQVGRHGLGWLDADVPALEDSSALLESAATPLARMQRQRLLARLEAVLDDTVIGRVVRARVHIDARWLVLSTLLALACFAWPRGEAVTVGGKAEQVRAAAAGNGIVLRVTPPKYTGVAGYESAPRELQVPEHSLVEWCFKSPQAQDMPLELSDGSILKLGRECARWSASESMFWRWQGTRYKLLVTPDGAPVITVTAPRDMVQVLARDAASAAIALTVRDDYMVRRATLHLTLARGSGENIRFSDREMPLPESSDPKVRNWSRQWTLAELGMEPGDELYFFVRATDNAERAHTTQSPTYTLRLPGPVEESDTSSALPMLVKPESLRSQRQIIIDTEQLVADMKNGRGISAQAARDRSQSIASDQAMLRRRYGQFLGEESSLFGGEEHEEHGEKHDVVAEFGHMHDHAESATLFDEATKKVLRRALGAMWEAEKALRAVTPKTALPPEYKALEAIKELQQADRIYLHKTAFVPPPLKEELRMTGDVAGARSYHREQGRADEAVPVEIRSLIQALAAGGPLPALWSREAHAWIRERIASEAARLEAQRAVQDVADGCVACRPVLRAWLRGAIDTAPVLLQAKPVPTTPFTRALRKGVAP